MRREIAVPMWLRNDVVRYSAWPLKDNRSDFLNLYESKRRGQFHKPTISFQNASI